MTTPDAEHTDAGGGYSCPVCAEARLAAEVAALRTRAERAESTVAVIRRRAVEHPKGLSAGYVLAAIDTPDPEEPSVDTPDLPSVLTLLEARTSTRRGAWASVIDAWGRDVGDTELLTMARDALRRALTEDTPGTDRELIAARTPPICATCNGSRLKPWKLLTDSELASALRTICHRTGASIPCPDCTEDTPMPEETP